MKTFVVGNQTISADFVDNRVPGVASFFQITEEGKEVEREFDDPNGTGVSLKRKEWQPAKVRLVAQFPLSTTAWLDKEVLVD